MAAGAAGIRGFRRHSSPGCLPGILPAGRGPRPVADTAVGKSSIGGADAGARCIGSADGAVGKSSIGGADAGARCIGSADGAVGKSSIADDGAGRQYQSRLAP
jgi:hypothetical protein